MERTKNKEKKNSISFSFIQFKTLLREKKKMKRKKRNTARFCINYYSNSFLEQQKNHKYKAMYLYKVIFYWKGLENSSLKWNETNEITMDKKKIIFCIFHDRPSELQRIIQCKLWNASINIKILQVKGNHFSNVHKKCQGNTHSLF